MSGKSWLPPNHPHADASPVPSDPVRAGILRQDGSRRGSSKNPRAHACIHRWARLEKDVGANAGILTDFVAGLLESAGLDGSSATWKQERAQSAGREANPGATGSGNQCLVQTCWPIRPVAYQCGGKTANNQCHAQPHRSAPLPPAQRSARVAGRRLRRGVASPQTSSSMISDT